MSTTFPGHSLAWSQAKAADRLRSYRCIFAVSLGLDVLLGLLAIFGPVTLARLIGLPEPFPEAWVRAWGLLLIGGALLYFPGWQNPISYRWPNWFGIVIRLALALLFLSQGWDFLPLAIWSAALVEVAATCLM